MNMLIRGKRLWIERSPWTDRVEFVLFERVSENQITHVPPVKGVAEKPEEFGAPLEPTFSLRMEEAQELMDDLWRIGLRPSEGTGSAGALAATQKHLEDMRKIVFDTLEKK